MAYVGTDDVYHNNFEYGPYQTMDSYDSVSLLIDADHSGGKGVDFNSGDQKKWEEVAGRTQKYDAVALAAGGPKLDESTIRWIRDWDLSFHVFPPYGDAAGSVIGETPTIITIEMYISPHNHWLKGVDSSPDQTEFSELAAGKIIGFAVMVTDMDGFDLAQSGMWIPLEMPSDDPDPEGLISFVWADAILDGLLVPAGQADTSVREDSWARIKATFISESGTSMLPTRRPVGYPAKSLRPAY